MAVFLFYWDRLLASDQFLTVKVMVVINWFCVWIWTSSTVVCNVVMREDYSIAFLVAMLGHDRHKFLWWFARVQYVRKFIFYYSLCHFGGLNLPDILLCPSNLCGLHLVLVIQHVWGWLVEHFMAWRSDLCCRWLLSKRLFTLLIFQIHCLFCNQPWWVLGCICRSRQRPFHSYRFWMDYNSVWAHHCLC